MNHPPRILVVDDNDINRDIMATRLGAHGYATLQAADGEEALAAVGRQAPDLIILDVMTPKLDGLEVCRRLKGSTISEFVPVILVTAKADTDDAVAGLDAGADEYLTKPIDQAALMARVRSVLRIKSLHDQVRAQAAALANLNQTLTQRVEEQLVELERIGRLKRFLPPQVARLSWCPPATEACWRVTVVRFPSFFVTYVASRPLPKQVRSPLMPQRQIDAIRSQVRRYPTNAPQKRRDRPWRAIFARLQRMRQAFDVQSIRAFGKSANASSRPSSLQARRHQKAQRIDGDSRSNVQAREGGREEGESTSAAQRQRLP
jgi:CheY-like chemotaxis protein